jgi:hypothetical protein
MPKKAEGPAIHRDVTEQTHPAKPTASTPEA